MIKMIVVDLDGTILDDDKKVPPTTKQYLTKLKNNGYIITIATGRILSSALNATDQAEFANYIITDNGSCVYKADTKELIYGNYLREQVADYCFNYYNDYCHYIDFCDKDKIYKYSDNPVYDKTMDNIIDNTKDKQYILNNCKNITHISMSIKNNNKILEIYNDILNKFKEEIEIIIMKDSFDPDKWFDIMSIGSSKYNMVSKLATYLNINNSEIIAFGDGINDIEMIKNCGKGIALINALEEVKNVSDDITKFDNNHDGVINYLKEFLNE